MMASLFLFQGLLGREDGTQSAQGSRKERGGSCVRWISYRFICYLFKLVFILEFGFSSRGIIGH
jgi:hypothetical protein